MSTVDTVSTALLAAHHCGARADASALPVPDYREALAIQRQVMAQLGAVGGFKVGPGAKPDEPVLAPIPAALVRPSGAQIPARDVIGIELEVGFEIVAEPTADPMADPRAIFRPRVVIEIVDTRLRGAEESPLLKMADLQINAGLVVGPGPDDWDGSDFTTLTGYLRCGDEVLLDGPAEVPGGSALERLALLCAHIGDHCGGLRTGQVLITGSLTGLPYFPAGTEIEGRLVGLGDISCSLV